MSAIYWDFTLMNIDVEFAQQIPMNEYELWWIINDKSGQKDENTARQKDNTQDSEGIHPISMN